MKKLGVGVIGAGFWGTNQVRVLRDLENIDLIAISDVSTERATETAQKYNVKPYSDLELLSRDDIDAVTICTPTTTHMEIALKAIGSGKHVLVEKPVCTTSKEATIVVEAARRKGIVLMPGHIERFNPAVQRVKSLIADGKLGKVILILARRVTRWPERVGDVGVIIDSAIHDVDVMRHLVDDEAKSVYAKTGSLRHRFEDYAEILIQFKKGETGFRDANWLTPRKIRTLVVTGSEATATVDYLTQEVTLEDSEKVTRPIVRWQEPLAIELRHFADAILSGKQPTVTGEDGVRAIEICEAAIESGRREERVFLTERV